MRVPGLSFDVQFLIGIIGQRESLQLDAFDFILVALVRVSFLLPRTNSTTTINADAQLRRSAGCTENRARRINNARFNKNPRP